MTKDDAIDLVRRYQIPIDVDFHTLSSEVVENILAAADERKYSKPKNANGSRARCFYAALIRSYFRKE